MKAREKRIKKALNIKRNNFSKRRKVVGGEVYVRNLGLAYLNVSAKNAGRFLSYAKTYGDKA